MGVGVIAGHADASHAHHVIDIADVVVDLVIAPLQLMGVLFDLMVRHGHLGHVAACAEDVQQTALAVAHGYQFQLIEHLRTVQVLGQGAVVVCRENLCDVHRLERVEVDAFHT